MPGWAESCPAACYDCLLSYANQPDHRYLDRHSVRDFLLRLARSRPIKTGGRTYDEQYAWLSERTDPASSFERAFLDHLHERKLPFPISPSTLQWSTSSFSRIFIIGVTRSLASVCL